MPSQTSPPTIRWGMLATGGIARTFAKDLTADPQTRGLRTLRHQIVAAASSTSKSTAEAFLQEVGAASCAKAYGSYAALVQDPNIDIVYISTPHSHHYQNAMLCLVANKNVLCEKPFTVNAGQARELVTKAREKNLFLMEALWTRYFPLSTYVNQLVTTDTLGPLRRVEARNDWPFHPCESFPDGTHRLVNLSLAGGALLELGVYSLTWAFQTLYTTQPPAKRQRPIVAGSAMKKFPLTGADVETTILLSFPRSQAEGGDVHAVASSSMLLHPDPGPAVRVQGSRGEVQIWPYPFRPTKTKLVLSDGTVEEKEWVQPGPGQGSGWVNGLHGWMLPEGEGMGMFWEADEAGMALLEGRKEGKALGLDESVMIMEVMDRVREANGLRYPEAIESVEYPLQLDGILANGGV